MARNKDRNDKPGLGTYVKEAFTWKWNLLALAGGAAAAGIMGGDIGQASLMMLVAAELTYLAGLVSIPRFRTAIDAKYASKKYKRRKQKRERSGKQSVSAMLNGLGPDARRRYTTLKTRVQEMRRLATKVQGKHESLSEDSYDLNAPSLNRLLWVFLRLLYSQQALNRFLSATDHYEIEDQIAAIKKQIEEHGDEDERITRSLTDTLATAEMRLDNYKKAEANEKYVAIELDRIEGKIRALTEMSLNHADPNYISSEVDSVAESMKHTESAMAEMQLITGLESALEEPPDILDDMEDLQLAGG